MFWCRPKRDVEMYVPVAMSHCSPATLGKLCRGLNSRYFGEVFEPWLHGLCIAHPWDIHDFMYATTEGEKARELADKIWLCNVLRLVDACDGPMWLRRRRYMTAGSVQSWLRQYGVAAFMLDKNITNLAPFVLPAGTNIKLHFKNIEAAYASAPVGTDDTAL